MPGEPALYPVILAGGASSRLWPLSGERRPKWDLRLFGPRSLLEETWARARNVAPAERCLVVGAAAQANLIRTALPELPAANLLLEPEPRDTAGAIAFAAGIISARDSEAVLLLQPSDHLISPLAGFAACARAAARAAAQEGALATFGIVPRGPVTGYGYIERGEPLVLRDAATDAPRVFRVRAFREKPAREAAEAYLRSGQYYWNGGMFAFHLPALREEFSRQLPGHFAFIQELAAAGGATACEEVVGRHYPALRKISIDFGILEHARKVLVVAAGFEWDDIGAWSAVGAHLPKRNGQAAGEGVQVEALEAADNVVVAPPGRRVALVGVERLAVVDAPEGLLVCRLAQDQLVKQLALRRPAVETQEEHVPTQGREIEVRIVKPPEVGPATGFLLMYHGYGESRLQHAETMERWAARYDLICIAPEFRDSGFDAYPNGKGARVPYDSSHLQLVDGLNAYHAARLRYLAADGCRAYVWGGSQGGHLALLSAELAAGTFALCVALSNVACIRPSSKTGDAAHFDAAALAIRDARRWAARVRCPVILAHGTADPKTPETNTRELACALADAGRDVVVRFVHGGDHRLGPATTWEAITEELGAQALHTARRKEADDFEARRAYDLPCPGEVTYRLDFGGGLAQFTRREGAGDG